jgi:NCS1 family nucleobase:cation symporter-1
MAIEIEHADGRVELSDDARIAGSPLFNHDLKPVRVKDRSWSTYNYAALWISMAHCIPTYMLASGLMDKGMSWAQALATIALGNLIVLAPILLNSHPGTKYGIPFPVFARASYGTYGSNLPALLRALVACGWFGIQAWIGGQAVHTLLRVLFPGFSAALGLGFGGHTGSEWFSFLLFWGLNILIVYKGMELLKHVENWAAPFVLVMTAALVYWAISAAHGLGPILAQPGKLHGPAFRAAFFPALTAMVGYWATLSLNMPDFTRFGHSQKDQALGQAVALPTTMTVFAGMGVVITSATAIIYGKAIWEPVELVGRFQSPLVVAVAMFTIVVATLSVNIAANVVSPANDFSNAFPKLLSFRSGGLITGLLGIAMQPWRLLESGERYIGWLITLSGGMGTVAGVLIADYWLLRDRRLALEDLYLPDGVYRYRAGWNPRAVAATAVGCFLAWGGLVLPPLSPLLDYGWFVGAFSSALSYLALAKLMPEPPGTPAPKGVQTMRFDR